MSIRNCVEAPLCSELRTLCHMPADIAWQSSGSLFGVGRGSDRACPTTNRHRRSGNLAATEFLNSVPMMDSSVVPLAQAVW